MPRKVQLSCARPTTAREPSIATPATAVSRCRRPCAAHLRWAAVRMQGCTAEVARDRGVGRGPTACARRTPARRRTARLRRAGGAADCGRRGARARRHQRSRHPPVRAADDQIAGSDLAEPFDGEVGGRSLRWRRSCGRPPVTHRRSRAACAWSALTSVVHCAMTAARSSGWTTSVVRAQRSGPVVRGGLPCLGHPRELANQGWDHRLRRTRALPAHRPRRPQTRPSGSSGSGLDDFRQ